MIVSGSRIRLMHIDNDPLAAGAFEALIEGIAAIELVTLAPRGVEVGLLEAYADVAPDVVMIDLHLDPRGDDGVAMAGRLMAVHPEAVVAICTASESPADAARAWEGGLPAYLTKRRLLAELASLPAVLSGIIDGHVLYHVDPRPGMVTDPLLSDREIEVLSRKAAGVSHRAIADELCLSVRTIDSHLANIRAKLDAPTMQDMLRIATERHLIDRGS